MIPKSGYRFFGLDHAQKERLNGYYFLAPSEGVELLPPPYCAL